MTLILLWRTSGLSYHFPPHISEINTKLLALGILILIFRFLLNGNKSSDPVYFGHKFKPFVNQGYFSGGAGYVLSKEAVKR